MGVVQGLAPQRVFHYFEQICRIPHGSGNTKEISDYLVSFAREHGLVWEQDQLNNVIIIKDSTAGYEKVPAVILQGHMDMVCEKEPEVDFDFLREGLRLKAEGDFIFAEGTTLGGDDGIAVAYMLALLEAEDVPHPRLEAVFTVDEETGMFGAQGIDLSRLQGHWMLNMDSEEEGSLLAGCAGGARAELCLPLERELVRGQRFEVRIKGLQGGHSGCEIHRQRGNANVLAGRLADGVEGGMRILGIEGGLKDNAIPRYALIHLVSNAPDAVRDVVGQWENTFRTELAGSDPEVCVELVPGEEGEFAVMTEECAARVCTAIVAAPNGVQGMSQFIPGLVETSLNLGIVETEEERMRIHFSVRSSLESAKQAIIRKLKRIAGSIGASCEVSGEYPAWPYRPVSPLRDRMAEVYERMYGEKPKIATIHAGLECGLLAAKIKDLDCVSFGPTIYDIHTPAERMSISSVERTWRYILKVLEETREMADRISAEGSNDGKSI